MEEEKKDLVLSAQKEEDKLINSIIEETDAEKLKDLTHLFNVYQTKRQALRMGALNDVQDALASQMLERLTRYPDNFSNGDIASWMKIVQGVIDSSRTSMEQIDSIPTITYQQNNNLNVTIGSELSRESRERALEAVKMLLQGDSSEEDSNVIDVDESENVTEEPSSD